MSNNPLIDRQISPKVKPEDKNLDGLIRPQQLKDFIGQEKLKTNLSILIEAAKGRNEPLDHTLFHGPPGLGKTTLSFIIANEMGVNIRITAGPAIEPMGSGSGIGPGLINSGRRKTGLSSRSGIRGRRNGHRHPSRSTS